MNKRVIIQMGCEKKEVATKESSKRWITAKDKQGRIYHAQIEGEDSKKKRSTPKCQYMHSQ